MQSFTRKVKIVLILVGAFLIQSLVSNSVFIASTPTINRFFFYDLAQFPGRTYKSFIAWRSGEVAPSPDDVYEDNGQYVGKVDGFRRNYDPRTPKSTGDSPAVTPGQQYEEAEYGQVLVLAEGITATVDERQNKTSIVIGNEARFGNAEMQIGEETVPILLAAP